MVILSICESQMDPSDDLITGDSLGNIVFQSKVVATLSSNGISLLKSIRNAFFVAADNSFYRLDIENQLYSLTSLLLTIDDINYFDFNDSLSIISIVDDSGHLYLYNYDTLELIFKKELHSNIATMCKFRKNSKNLGEIWTCSMDYSLIKFDYINDKVLKSWDFNDILKDKDQKNNDQKSFNPKFVFAFDFSPCENFIAVGLGDGSLCLIDIGTSSSAKKKKPLNLITVIKTAHAWSITCLEFICQPILKDGKAVSQPLITGSIDGTVCFWETLKPNVAEYKNSATSSCDALLMKRVNLGRKIDCMFCKVVERDDINGSISLKLFVGGPKKVLNLLKQRENDEMEIISIILTPKIQ